MANRTPTTTKDIKGSENNAILKVVWTGLLNGDVGLPVFYPDYTLASWQVSGTFGAGGSISMQGSNDGTNFITLEDPQGGAQTKTAAALEEIEQPCLALRPTVTAGDGTTSLVATLVLWKTFAGAK